MFRVLTKTLFLVSALTTPGKTTYSMALRMILRLDLDAGSRYKRVPVKIAISSFIGSSSIFFKPHSDMKDAESAFKYIKDIKVQCLIILGLIKFFIGIA
jgi:hypothetical protein